MTYGSQKIDHVVLRDCKWVRRYRYVYWGMGVVMGGAIAHLMGAPFCMSVSPLTAMAAVGFSPIIDTCLVPVMMRRWSTVKGEME